MSTSRSPSRSARSGSSHPSEASPHSEPRQVVPVAQYRSHKLEPIILQPKIPRPRSAGRGRGTRGALDLQLPAVGGEAPRPPRAEAEPAIRSAREPRAGGAIQSSPPPAPPDRGRGMDTSASRATRKRPPGEHRPLQVGDLPTSATALDPTTGAACHAPPPIPREEVVSEASPSSRSPASHLTRNRSQRSSNRARLSSPGSPESRMTSTKREGSAPSASHASIAYAKQGISAPPKNRTAKYGGVKKGKAKVTVPPAAFMCLSRVAAGIREMNWTKMYKALEILARFLIPCEAVTLYLVEEGGRYLRRVNSFLDAFPPERRGPSLQPVSESTLQGACAMKAEPCGLPVRARTVTKAQVEWASSEAMGLYPVPSKGTFHDLSAGGAPESDESMPTVSKVRNVLAFPLCFGSPSEEDPFGDYASVDSEHALADPRVFGVLKMTNRLSRGRAAQLHLTSAKDRAETKYQPFGKRDTELLECLNEFLREVYFSIDPVTFGPRDERSLDVREEFEPLNAPSLMSGTSQPSRSHQSGKLTHQQSGSRLLSHVKSGGSAVSMAAGMFGILGNAFAKGTAQRRAELPDLVQRPEVRVTSDSTEAMRAAPGWVYKEWTDEDMDFLGADHVTAQRRIGGITLLATWCLKDVKVDPFCVICRFQIRVARTSRLGPSEQAVWKEAQPFFCVSADEGQNQLVSAFLSDFLRYGEEYIVSVRAGSADRWSEWSAPSEPKRLKACDLEPANVHMRCEFLHQEPAMEAFGVQDHVLHVAFPAFGTFDSRSPLPVEYCIEAWQRPDVLGAASTEELHAYARSLDQPSRIPGAGPEWLNATPIFVTTVKSDQVQGKIIECEVDLRKTPLVPLSQVYFSVKARYLSLPLETNFSPKYCWSQLMLVPELLTALPSPEPFLSTEFLPDAQGGGLGSMVLRWPFRHPAHFCEMESGDWHKGPFVPKALPGEFPLPFRVQCRVLRAASAGEPPRWSEWREVGAYKFVKRQTPQRHPSQRVAGRWASQGQFPSKSEGGSEFAAEEECFDPSQDPLGIMSEWALLVTGVGSEESPWSGLTQLRWVSCTVEGAVSAPSETLCTRIAPPCEPPEVEHLVVNCSSSNVTGRRDQIDEEAPVLEEQVVYELRHVARLSWQLDAGAPSFSFLHFFQIHYKEVPPDKDEKELEWQHLPLTPLQEAADNTNLDEALTTEQRARFSFEVTSIPLLRFHRYRFAVQVLSHEHASAWSRPSRPLHLVLPEVLPPKALEEASTEEGSEEEYAEHREENEKSRPGREEEDEAKEETGRRKHEGKEEEDHAEENEECGEARRQKDEAAEDEEEGTVEETGRRKPKEKEEEDHAEGNEESQTGRRQEDRVACKKGKPGRVKLFDAEIQCQGEDASTWQVELRWRPFPRGGEAFPALDALAVEYQVSYFVLSERPCAESKESATRVGPSFVQGSQTSHYMVHQRQSATVCLEGSIAPEEQVVIRHLPRFRLPPLRCDVRLFLASRCMAITGPSWSKEALYVDLCLPRQVALPLPVPEQLSCLALLRHGIQMDIGTHPGAEPQPEGLWAVLKIEKFPREFVLDSHSQVGDDDLLELGSPAPKAHYILQYRCYDPDVPFSSASACPLVEEKYWREVPIIKPLDGGEDRVFLAAGLDSGALTKTKEHCWAKFRLASRVWSHFSFASLAAPVSPLQPPARPELSVEWVDSPSLDGLRIRVSAPCDMLSQAYQLRFRLSKDSSKSAWQLCDLVPMKLEALGQEGLSVEALAPTDQLHYHSEYHFSIRTCSLFRFSPWSEDSTAFRISLEHEGMCQDECGVEVEIYGQEERHNCRCPVADVSWAPLALPKAVDLTIEYRLRWRRRLPAYNDAVALYAAMDELRSIHDQGDEWQGRREEASGGVRPVRLMVPDPDEQLQDIANRGYLGDCTKRFHGLPEFSPWQLAAVVRAKVGPQSVKRCSYALTFLQSGADYEVQVDWRWQRLGDSFWMPAYPAKRFHMPSAPQQPPLLRPLRILPEVLDGHEQLQSLCNLCQQEGQRLGRGFGLFEWPFEQPPALAQMLALAPTGSQLTEEWRRDPGLYGTFTVQCRRQSWVLCQVALLEISGKAACFVFAPPEQPLEDQRTADATDEPKPTPLPEMPQLEDGDMEFRVLRTNDCEVSEVLTYPALPLEPPVDVQCRLKMTGPQSAFGVAICFRGLPSPGFASAPEEYQIRMQEMQGSEVVKEEVLPPRRLPMNRVAEAFPDALQRPDFLGQARSLECAVRSGGQPERRLEELEFEHFLTDVIYGKTYHIAVRWMSKFKVSPWSAVAKSDVSFPPPTTAEEVLSVKLLPDATMSAELAGKDFSPPALWHRFQLTWQPFMASLWGSRMEYRLERRSLLHDRRTSPEGILPELDSAELETSPWELIGQVMADIDDASGKGCYQLQSRRKGHTKEELLQSFHAKDGRPRDEQLDGLFGRRSETVELSPCYDGETCYHLQIVPRIESGEQDESVVLPRKIARTVLDMVYTSHVDQFYGDTSFARMRLARALCRTVYAGVGGASDETQDEPAGAPKTARPVPNELVFPVEELQPSVTYQFRLFTRLHFHPAFDQEGEWSAPLLSAWHRTPEAVPPPPAPREAVVPDPPPLELLEEGSVLLIFDELPIREPKRPEPAPGNDKPAPFQLQFRGALEPVTADWQLAESKPLDGDQQKIVVKDSRLSQFAEDGVIFRLWRPQMNLGDSHRVEDDARVRHFGSLSSVSSNAIRPHCANFDEWPKATLVLQASADLRQGMEDPPPTAMLRLDWKVHVPSNSALLAVRLHQVRFRRVQPLGKDDNWQELIPFECHIAVDKAWVRREIPLVGPNFLFGADYEVCVRMGTDLRWGNWSPPEKVSLAIHPPQPPREGVLQLEDVHLPDGATFFRLTWPAFDTHPLCNLIEYRIRMQRVSHFRYMERLSEEILARAQESFAAQEEAHLVGTIRVRVPQTCGPAKGFGAPYKDSQRESLEFVHRVAGDAECGYRFFVDAKHEHYRQVDGQQDSFLKFAGEQEDWSVALESRESVVPPMPRNTFVPEQVPVDADPDADQLRAAFPLKLEEYAVDRLLLAEPSSQRLVLFAPWQVAKEASRWPHRVEYSPYLPDVNGGRLPIPGDMSEDKVDWHLPITVEYLWEAQSERPLARGPEECCFVLAKGFDESLWETEMARLDLHRDQMKALGLFARVRVVREGGPEGMQLLSSPSRPLRLYMPPVDDLKVTVWSTNGRFCALLWWPSIVAACAEIDKNLDMSGQLHQVRLRRPDYEHDAGWVQGQVKRTLPPVSIQRSTGAYAPHTFDLCSLLDDSIVQEELLNEALPKQPYGAFRNPRQLTYEFSVRVSDGYRWSDWSASSARCCFAVEPKIVTTAPVELNELHQLLTGKSDVVSAAHSVDLTKPLTDQLTFLQDGEMEPPRWVTISKKPPESTALAETARLSQFVASWPNLPPAAYSQPETTILTAAHKILETGSLPPFVTPPLLYRINVWLVGVSPDAADVDVDVRTVGDDNKDLLYRQYDVPPSSYPVDKSDQQSVKELSWILPSLLPDKIFRCTLEARFETNTSVNWWTPLMESGPFVVERVPPPAPPELLPVAELPTPEQQKLLTRLAPGSRASITLRWPWCVEGRHTDLLKESSHVLEFCRSAAHQTFRDPSGVPVNTLGETAFSGRPLGPWREAKALQLCFANFVKNEVLFELSEEAISEPNWVPALVASGLWDAEGEDEPESVHLRWRYRAGLSELATTNSTLHFSASSGPVRTIITMPSTVSLHLEVPERASRLAGWLQWKAWQGSEKHQFSYRILSKQKKKRHLRGSLLSESESTDTLDEAMLSTPRSEAGNHHAVTGWIEMPPVFDNIKRHIEAEVDHEDLLLQGEASQLADFERKLSGTEWQHILWRHYHTKQEEFWDPARLYGESESSWQFSSSLNAGASTMSDTARSSLGSTKTRDVPFRIRPSHLLEWRVRVSDGLRWSEWSAPSPASQLAPPIPSLAGPVRLIFNRREPTVAKVVWSGCETLIENEHLMQSIEYLVFMSIDENSGRELIQDEGSFDVERLHNWGVHLSDGSCGRLLPHVGKEGEAVPAFDFESLFSEDSQKRLLGKFRHREMRTVSAEGDGGPPTVQGFELHVSGLKPHCMHRISVCVRCAVENLPEPDWQRLKLDPSHPMRWSEPFHSSPLLTPLRPPPMLVPELVPVPDGRFGRFLHTPCILLKCAMFAKQNKNDSDKDHSVVVDCRPAGSTDEDYRLVQHSIYCEPVEHGPCRLVYNLPFLHAEIRTRNITMNDVSAASIPFFAVPPLTIQDCQGPKVQMVVGKEGTLCVRLEWTSRCLPAQKPKLLQIGVRRHAVDQVCAEHASHSILPEMCLEELFTSALCTGKDFEELMQAAESRYQDQGGVLRDQSPYYCRHCFQPFQRKVSDDLPNIGPLGEAWIREVPDVLRLSAVAVEEIGPGNRVDIAALRAPHCIELDHHMREDANPWEAIRKAKTPCGCRDIFCRKDMHVDGEQLVHGTVYTFKLRVSDGHRWSAWTEYSPPMQVVIPPPRPPSRQENLVPTPPPTVEVVFVKDEDDTLQSAVEGLKGPDIRLRLRWPRFEGRMQEVEYRILMWTLTPELRKRAVAREKGLPPIVGVQSFFTSSSFPGVTAQVDESLGPRIVRPVVPDCSPVARARPRSLQSGMQDTPEIIAHIQPLDPAERGFKEKNELPQTLEAEVNVVAIPKSHGYVFAVEAKHCRGALGNLGEWSPPMFSRCIEFQHQSKELSLEVDARFGAMLFKGQAATQPKPKNEKVQMEANAVSFVDEHRDLPKAMPLLTNPGGDPWPIGASPKKFIMRTKGRTVYAERLDDEKIPELPEARPRKDDFREA